MSDAPPPLTPSDCDLTDFGFMPVDVARVRDSELASSETPEACWAAFLLWCASWHQVPAASIPDDDRWIAKQAGYAQRGKIAKEWKDVRSGALHGWLKCSDGRLYHPVVAEKAIEAWNGKLRQRWGTECARVKKYNQRHSLQIYMPSFDEWLSLGCPKIQIRNVPDDVTECPQGQNDEVPGTSPESPDENGSKGQGKGQGYKKEEEGGGVARETAPDYSASDQAKTITARFLDLRTEIWPNESGFPAPTMTLETQAQGFLDAGGPIDLIIEVMERSMRQAAQQGRTAANSLKAFGQSIRNAIISHKNQPNLGVLTDGPAARGESRPSGTGRATGYDPFGRERRSGVMEGPILDLSVDRG